MYLNYTIYSFLIHLFLLKTHSFLVISAYNTSRSIHFPISVVRNVVLLRFSDPFRATGLSLVQYLRINFYKYCVARDIIDP
jgi:hypothetical protein